MKKPSRTAIHEAAHAVTAHLLAWRVMEIVVNGRSGYCVHRHAGGKRVYCPFQRAMISLAGHRAEVLWCGADMQMLPRYDWNRVRKDSDFSMFAANWAGFVAEKLLKENKNLVMLVARKLDEVGSLDEAGFLKIVSPFIKKNAKAVNMSIPLRLRK